MEQKSNQNIDILYVLQVFLSRWPIFLISGLFFMICAVLYLNYSAKTYKVFSQIIIKTEGSAGGRGSSRQYMNVDQLMNQEKSFTNEIAFLRSTPLIKEVIQDMNLSTSYYIKEDKIPRQLNFGFINIYKQSPFIVVLDKSHPQPLNTKFYLNIIDNESFVIAAESPNARLYYPDKEEISNYERYFYFTGEYKFGETISNEYCSFKILLNSNYNEAQYRGKDLFFRINSPERMAHRFRENLEVSTAFYQSSIANLTFVSENLNLAEEFLSRLIDKYIQKNLEKKNYDANNTIEYINNQLEIMSGSLGQSEEQLQNFRRNRDVMNIDEKSASIFSQLQSLRMRKNELQTEYQNLQQINRYFEENKDTEDFIAPSFGIADQTLSNLIQELMALTSERQDLISRNLTRSPRLKTLEINIRNINQVIEDNLKFNLTATQNKLDDLNNRISELEREFSSLPGTQRQLTGLQREFSINNAVYTSLLDNKMQAQIAKASNRPDAEIVEPVTYMEIDSPSAKKVLAIALFFAIFLPSMYVIPKVFLSSKIQTKDELKRYTSLPFAGSIPHIQKNVKNQVLLEPQSPASEGFHSLRSNLVYYLFGEKNKIIILTSSIPEEGKTVISLNLATSFATTSNKTLLMSFDLRKKNYLLKELRENNKAPGISSYLIKKADVEDIIHKTEIENLDYIDSGEIPPDPVALISTSRTEELFASLREKYDYIIIDTPPYGIVTDAFLLMNNADLTVYISRLGVTTKKVFRQSMEDIELKRIKNVFVLQNDITKIDKGYNEKYAYAYAENDKKRKRLRLFRRSRKK